MYSSPLCLTQVRPPPGPRPAPHRALAPRPPQPGPGVWKPEEAGRKRRASLPPPRPGCPRRRPGFGGRLGWAGDTSPQPGTLTGDSRPAPRDLSPWLALQPRPPRTQNALPYPSQEGRGAAGRRPKVGLCANPRPGPRPAPRRNRGSPGWTLDARGLLRRGPL